MIGTNRFDQPLSRIRLTCLNVLSCLFLPANSESELVSLRLARNDLALSRFPLQVALQPALPRIAAGGVLDMEQCGIGDGEGLPQQMGQLQLLEILKLRNNAIGGVLPEGLFSCTRLETIDLSGNLIRGTTPGPRELGRARSAAGAALTEQQHRGRDPGEHWWLHLPAPLGHFGQFPHWGCAVGTLETMHA
jgi:hypothetical protein